MLTKAPCPAATEPWSSVPEPDQAGEYVRSLVIDDKYGWVVEQQVTDSAGQLIAAAKASNHRFYPTAGVSLPHHIDVRFPPAQLTFSIDVGQYSINQLAGDPLQLWSLPQLEGYTPVNLADAAVAPMRPSTAPRRQPPQSPGTRDRKSATGRATAAIPRRGRAFRQSSQTG